MDGKLVCVYVKVKATWADSFLHSAAFDDLSSASNENFSDIFPLCRRLFIVFLSPLLFPPL